MAVTFLALTNEGIEEVLVEEVKELVKGKAEVVLPGMAKVTVKEAKDLYKFVYGSQTIRRAIYLLQEFTADTVEDAVKQIKIDVKKFSGETYATRCLIHDQEISRISIEQEFGKTIGSQIGLAVDLKTPELSFAVIWKQGTCFIGIDIVPEDLGKRAYRIYSMKFSIKAPIIYAMLRWAKYKPGQVLVDPFSKDGTVAIEAALFTTKIPVQKFERNNFRFYYLPEVKKEEIDVLYDKMDKGGKFSGKIVAMDKEHRFIEATKKNAKLAGIHKQVTLSRQDVDWLEVAFDDDAIDCIVTNPPQITQKQGMSKLRKTDREVFKQARHVLKKDGRICFIVHDPSQFKIIAQDEGFTLDREQPVMQGQQPLTVLVWRKD